VLTNIDALSSLVNVQGPDGLYIWSNAKLLTIGLTSLNSTTNDISIYSNAALLSFDAVPALTWIGGVFTIYSNTAIKYINCPLLAYNVHTAIYSNAALLNISLPLTFSPYVEIYSNAKLDTIIGYNGVDPFGIGVMTMMTIYSNSVLRIIRGFNGASYITTYNVAGTKIIELTGFNGCDMTPTTSIGELCSLYNILM
jgi:hypothetical protein